MDFEMQHSSRARSNLWYGDRDKMAPQADGEWLAQQLSNAELVICRGEGHLPPLRHWQEMLRTLITVR